MRSLFIFGLLIIMISGCNNMANEQNEQTQEPETNLAICPKGLSYNDCPNPTAMHGQIMIHNMTDKSYDVQVEHHDNQYELKRISPGDGWTFIGVIQGKRLLSAVPTLGGYTFESNCTVIGNTQHMMNVMPKGFVVNGPKAASELTQEAKKDTVEIIRIPIRREAGH